MREVARRVALSHSAIVAAAKKLRLAALVRADGRPLVPELFWALAEAWHPGPVDLAELPAPGTVGLSHALTADLDRDGPGWAVAGSVGAAAWGAPLVIGGAYPPDFYVPTTAELRQATLRLGVASRVDERACTVAVAPTPLVCVERFDRESNECSRSGPGASTTRARPRWRRGLRTTKCRTRRGSRGAARHRLGDRI